VKDLFCFCKLLITRFRVDINDLNILLKEFIKMYISTTLGPSPRLAGKSLGRG